MTSAHPLTELGALQVVRKFVNRVFLLEDRMKSLIVRFVREDQGQDLIEYALLAAFLALVSIAALQLLGLIIAKSFGPAINALP